MEDEGSGQWTSAEVTCLLSLWGEESAQAKIQGLYRNKSVYEEISAAMGERGFKRSWLQCQRKIKTLKSKYKEVKDHNSKSGNCRITCPFYDQMEVILGDKPSCRPPEILDSSRQEAASSVDGEDTECDNITDELPDTPETTSSSEKTTSSSVTTKEATSRASTPTPGTHQQERSGTGASTTRKKRKNKMESTVEVFGQKIKDYLSQTDDTELQLKLQSAQHAHELRMMTLFTQFLAGRQSHQPEMPPLHPGHTTQSSSYPDHVHPPRFGQDYARPPPFHQDHTHPIPLFHQNDAYPLPPSFYQDYASAGPSHHSHPPFFQEDHTHLLPPFRHDTQPSPSHQAHIHSQPINPAQPKPSSPQPQSATPQPFEDD